MEFFATFLLIAGTSNGLSSLAPSKQATTIEMREGKIFGPSRDQTQVHLFSDIASDHSIHCTIASLAFKALSYLLQQYSCKDISVVRISRPKAQNLDVMVFELDTNSLLPQLLS